MVLLRLFVRNLVVPCSIGVHRHELDAPQRVRVTVEIDMIESFTPESDTIGAVLSYDQVVASVREIVNSGHINLVETLADRIAASCVRNDRVAGTKVMIEKLDVLGGEATVGAEIIRGEFR